MKKALIVANSSGLITLFLKNDVELLLERGYQIECACNTDFPDKNTDEFFKKYNISVTHVEFPIRDLDVKMIFSSYRKLRKLVRAGNYDIVHCHSTIVAALARQCAKKYKKSGLKVLYTSHGFPFYKGAEGKKIQLYKIIEQHYSKYTDAIITICSEDYENAKKMYCQNVYKINGVGIDLDRFTIKEFDRESYRKFLDFKENDKVILSIGEINTNKNHQIVIKAIAHMNDSNIVYAICGREVTELGKKQELEQLALDFGVNLRFLGFRFDIPEICHSADIGALPSFKEGLGLSGVEMLAAGIPVVGANRQGIKDYILNGETGYLCNPESVESFAEGIKRTFKLCNNSSTKRNCIEMSKMFGSVEARKKIATVFNEILGD